MKKYIIIEGKVSPSEFNALNQSFSQDVVYSYRLSDELPTPKMFTSYFEMSKINTVLNASNRIKTEEDLAKFFFDVYAAETKIALNKVVNGLHP